MKVIPDKPVVAMAELPATCELTSGTWEGQPHWSCAKCGIYAFSEAEARRLAALKHA